MNYWLNLFSEESWHEFVRNGSKMSGFNANRWGFARQVQVGDCMPCYMTGGRGFFGVTVVTETPFSDDSLRWEGFDFTVWIPLEMTLLLSDGRGIRPPDLHDLSWMRDRSHSYWISRVRAALTQIDEADGEIIVAALEDKLQLHSAL